MESHMCSSFNNKISSDQESGWSAYLDDFPLINQNEETYCSNSSLVSDAAWNGSFDPKNIEQRKKMDPKSRASNRKKYFWDDDDLQDTASFPVNTPKVSSRKSKKDGKYKPKDAKGKQVEGAEDKNMRENDYFDLKKKGLCLVPFSSFMD